MPRYKAPAPKFVPARWHGGEQTPRLIVMHSTVGPTKAGSALAIANMFKDTDRAASAHYVVDEAEVYQCVGDHTVAYHCGYNQDSIGVEMCDYPVADSAKRWDDAVHKALFANAGRLVAELCLAYDIRPWFVGPLALRAGVKGVTTHANMSQAFKKSTHWDPGAWPRRAFMREVRRQVKAIKAGK